MLLILRVLTLVIWVLVVFLRSVYGDPSPGTIHYRGAPFIVDLSALPILHTTPGPLEATPSPPADLAIVELWSEPATAWMELALRLIVADGSAPPHAARDLMLLGVALHDGLRAAEAADQPISHDALFAEIAPRILAYTHPLHADTAHNAAETAAWVGVWQGAAAPETILPSRMLGAAVAHAVLAWAAADGAAAPVGEPLLLEPAPDRWAPTPPFFEAAQLPHWGAVRTVVIGDPAIVRSAAPPAWDDPSMERERMMFKAAQDQLNDVDRELAAAWAAGVGTVTPPGMWMERAIGLVRRDALSTPEATRVYAALGVALHDVAVACWETKYHYQVARPIQWLGKREPDWKPFLATPPHPSYPSGHAGFSGAGGTVLAAFFSNDAVQLLAEAESAAASRIVGGIHWPMDGVAGIEQGRVVAEQALEHAGMSGAGAEALHISGATIGR